MKPELKKKAKQEVLDYRYICQELNSKYEPLRPMIDTLCHRLLTEVDKEDLFDLWNEYHWEDNAKIRTHEEFVSDNSIRMVHPMDTIEFMKRASEGYWVSDDEFMYEIDDYQMCSSDFDDLFIFDEDIFKGVIYRTVNEYEFENYFRFDKSTEGSLKEDLENNPRVSDYIGEKLMEEVVKLNIEIYNIDR